jgi:hypothetical protein
MAINASALPALFAASTWQSGGSYLNAGVTKYVASADGAWVETPESDLFHVTEADFIAIAGATPNGSLLTIDGIDQEVMGRRISGVRYLLIADPE